MMKRFVAMLVVVLMVVGCAAVACADVPYPSCGHDSFTSHETISYEKIDNAKHRKIITIMRTCDTCKATTEGTEYTEEFHTKAQSDRHNENGTHYFTLRCTVCGKFLESATLMCSGNPHVPSPFMTQLD